MNNNSIIFKIKIETVFLPNAKLVLKMNLKSTTICT